jgi:flavin-dependent dehydrogenase
VDIITGTKAKSIEIETDQPSVYADKKYTAEYIVAADGSHSMAMRHVPLKRKKIGDFFELEIEADNMDLPRDSFYAEFRDITTGLYAQTYGEGYMLGVFQGLGDNGKRIDLKEYMAESIQKLKVHNVTRRYGCAMPLHFSASSSYYKNILLAGDCVSSFSMATITGAMLTGLLAAQAVIEKSDGVEGAFEEYDKAWRKELQQASLDRMKSYFFLLKRLNQKRMGRLFKALAGADLG